MKYLGIAICLLSLWGTSVEAGFFKFEDCSGDDSISKVEEFNISPDPVLLRRNNLTATVDLRILQDVPENAILRTRYYKLKSIFGINVDVPIPCILGKFGSCTLPLCKYLKLFQEQAEPLFPNGTEYGCPLRAGTFGGKEMEIKIPDMGSFARLIVSGRYRTELELVADRKVLACFKIHVEMK